MLDKVTYRFSTIAGISDVERLYIRRTATENGLALNMLDLYDSDKIGPDHRVIVVYRLADMGDGTRRASIAGWGLCRGYLGIYVDPACRRQGIGESLVKLFVDLDGNDLRFSTKDPSAARMFRKYLAKGIGRDVSPGDSMTRTGATWRTVMPVASIVVSVWLLWTGQYISAGTLVSVALILSA